MSQEIEIGARRGRLVLIEKLTPALFLVRCDCGTEKAMYKSKFGHKALSCGCFKSEATRAAKTTHGMHGSRTWKSWTEMRQRCDNPNKDNYRYYGGAGISYDPRWSEFKCFLDDMGERPPGMSLDRIESSKNYIKENCRWATHTQQTRNRPSFNRMVTVRGETLCLAEMAERYGIKLATAWQRLNAGRAPDEAFTTPVRSLNSNRRAGIV